MHLAVPAIDSLLSSTPKCSRHLIFMRTLLRSAGHCLNCIVLLFVRIVSFQNNTIIENVTGILRSPVKTYRKCHAIEFNSIQVIHSRQENWTCITIKQRQVMGQIAHLHISASTQTIIIIPLGSKIKKINLQVAAQIAAKSKYHSSDGAI